MLSVLCYFWVDMLFSSYLTKWRKISLKSAELFYTICSVCHTIVPISFSVFAAYWTNSIPATGVHHHTNKTGKIIRYTMATDRRILSSRDMTNWIFFWIHMARSRANFLKYNWHLIYFLLAGSIRLLSFFKATCLSTFRNFSIWLMQSGPILCTSMNLFSFSTFCISSYV